MGNCIRRESSMKWAGEDWGCLANDHHDHEDEDEKQQKQKQTMKKRKVKIEEDEDEGEGPFSNSTANNNNNDIGATRRAVVAKELKIKITKKQLEELLGRAELKQMSVEQVLTQLIQLSRHHETHPHQRSWRPALHTIPEVNNLPSVI